jgi:hypothetical protein
MAVAVVVVVVVVAAAVVEVTVGVVVTVAVGYFESYLWITCNRIVYLGSLAMRDAGKDQIFVRNVRNCRNKASYEMKTSTSYLIDKCVINPELILYTTVSSEVNYVAVAYSFSRCVTSGSQKDVSRSLVTSTRLRVQQVSMTTNKLTKLSTLYGNHTDPKINKCHKTVLFTKHYLGYRTN